jgi:hypothetical protein
MNHSEIAYFEQTMLLVGVGLLTVAFVSYCASPKVELCFKALMTPAGIRYLGSALFIRGLGVWLLYATSTEGYFTGVTNIVYNMFRQPDCTPPLRSCLEYFAEFVVLLLVSIYFLFGAPPVLKLLRQEQADTPARDWQLWRSLLAVGLCVLLFVYSSEFWTTDGSGSVFVKRISLRQLVQIMNQGIGWKIAFAETPFSDSPHITNRELLAELESIPQKQRTSMEVDWIRAWEDLFKQHSGLNIDIPFAKEERFSLNMPKSVLTSKDKQKVVETICALNERYSLKQANTIYVLSDKDSIVNTDRISLRFANISLEDAVTQLMKLLDDRGIELNGLPQSQGQGSGMKDNSTRYWPWWMPLWGGEPIKYESANPLEKRITLNLQDVTLAQAFSRFAEALGPNVTWQLLESSHYKFLLFDEVHATDCWNSTLSRY